MTNEPYLIINNTVADAAAACTEMTGSWNPKQKMLIIVL